MGYAKLLIYYLKIVRHPTVSDSTRLKNATPKKKWPPPYFGVEGIGANRGGKTARAKERQPEWAAV